MLPQTSFAKTAKAVAVTQQALDRGGCGLRVRIQHLIARGLLTRDTTIQTVIRALTRNPEEGLAHRRSDAPPSELQQALRQRRWPSRVAARNLGISRERYLSILRGQGLLSNDEEQRLLLIVRAYAATKAFRSSGVIAEEPA